MLSFAQIFAMRYVTALLFVSATLFAACNNTDTSGPKAQEALPESKHSAAFNQSVQSVLQTYYRLAEAFVNWDSVAASSLANELDHKLDSLRLNELKKDNDAHAEAPVAAAKKDLSGMIASGDITSKRHALNALTDHLYQFLNAVQYDREKLYLQECPMAFNDEDAGVWLSPGDSIRNPYLGLHHPYYGKGMLECGSNKEVLNFTGTK